MTPMPTPDVNMSLYVVGDSIIEMLQYCGNEVLEHNPNNCDYDADKEELIYYLKVSSLDRELFPMLGGTDEIWIVVDASIGGAA